jgi:SPW repeat
MEQEGRSTGMEQTQRWKIASGLVILTGVWLVIVPFVLGYADQPTPTTSDIFYGVVIATVALIRTFWGAGSTWLSWVNVVLGFGVLLAPLYLTYGLTESAIRPYDTFPLINGQSVPLWNDLITGAVVIVLAAASTAIERSCRHSGRMDPAAKRALAVTNQSRNGVTGARSESRRRPKPGRARRERGCRQFDLGFSRRPAET